MPKNRISTVVLYCKIAILVLSVVVLGVGLHSHFQSSWKTDEVYKRCKGLNVKPDSYKDGPCPAISMEEFYVSQIIIFFVLSTLIMAVGMLLDFNNGIITFLEIGYHGIAAIMLFIAAVVYIVSADQIYRYRWHLDPKNPTYKMRHTEKFAAGFLTMIQVILYAITAILLFVNQ